MADKAVALLLGCDDSIAQCQPEIEKPHIPDGKWCSNIPQPRQQTSQHFSSQPYPSMTCGHTARSLARRLALRAPAYRLLRGLAWSCVDRTIPGLVEMP